MAKTCWVVCHKDGGHPCPPIDRNDSYYGGKTPDAGMMAFWTKAGCEAACRNQDYLYGLSTEPRRLEDVVKIR